MKNPLCCHCATVSVLRTGRDIYPRYIALYHKYYWQCPDCGAYVGCHKRTSDAMGTPANKELRTLRVQVHTLLDPLWRVSGKSRTKVYKWLARQLRISRYSCHIGMFDNGTCEKAKEILKTVEEI